MGLFSTNDDTSYKNNITRMISWSKDIETLLFKTNPPNINDAKVLAKLLKDEITRTSKLVNAEVKSAETDAKKIGVVYSSGQSISIRRNYWQNYNSFLSIIMVKMTEFMKSLNDPNPQIVTDLKEKWKTIRKIRVPAPNSLEEMVLLENLLGTKL
ncbi:hypothetical protein HY485_02225 [Candidatus Woesearchaeota archaeon]|nr:hypothetical protein [Candidatus Woesearchaeota archaeon]